MVKRSFNTARGMAFITGDAGIRIATNIIMLVVHRRLIVIMTINTTEGFQASRGSMTFRTCTPGTGMLP